MNDEMIVNMLKETTRVAEAFTIENKDVLNTFGMIKLDIKKQRSAFVAGWVTNEAISRGVGIEEVIRIIVGVNHGIIKESP